MAAATRSAVLSKARKFILARSFQGEPQLSDMQLVEEELPALRQGQVLCEAEFLSLDPYQRAYSYRLKAGDTMLGSQVARIVQSRAPAFPEGRLLVGYYGWRDRTVVDPLEEPRGLAGFAPPMLVPELGDLSPSLALGVLGMPGNTAYFGLLEICKPQPGEVVVVTGAAGAVGSLVGQIAKIKGCKAVGVAGSDEKVRWLTQELGFDAAFNYKTVGGGVAKALRAAAPDGVDAYFDNVGGEMSSAVISQMRKKGRIAVCGSISSYNNLEPKKLPLAPIVQPAMVMHLLRMEGFNVYQWRDRWDEGVQQNLRWIREGKLKYRETVTHGFENLPKAFIGMMNGENLGKAVLKV